MSTQGCIDPVILIGYESVYYIILLDSGILHACGMADYVLECDVLEAGHNENKMTNRYGLYQWR